MNREVIELKLRHHFESLLYEIRKLDTGYHSFEIVCSDDEGRTTVSWTAWRRDLDPPGSTLLSVNQVQSKLDEARGRTVDRVEADSASR